MNHYKTNKYYWTKMNVALRSGNILLSRVRNLTMSPHLGVKMVRMVRMVRTLLRVVRVLVRVMRTPRMLGVVGRVRGVVGRPAQR